MKNAPGTGHFYASTLKSIYTVNQCGLSGSQGRSVAVATATKAAAATATATTAAAAAAFATAATVWATETAAAAAFTTAATVAATTTTTTVATATSAWRTSLHRTGFVDHQAAATQRCAVHAFNSSKGFGIAAHFHKSKTFGTTCIALHHDFGAGHSTELSERLLKIAVAYRIRQIADVQFIAHERDSLKHKKQAMESRMHNATKAVARN